MLRLKDFMAEGIGPETLARLVRKEAIVRPARRLYQLPDAQIEAGHMLAQAAVLVPKGIVCLASALQYHEMTLQMPSAVWMAIERTAWLPKLDYPRIRFVRFTGPALTEVSSAIVSGRRCSDHQSGENHRRLFPLPGQCRPRCSHGATA